MSNYTVLLSKKAQKQLDKLSDSIAQPIIEAIALLEGNWETKNSKDGTVTE